MKPFIDKRLFVSKVKDIGYGVFASKYIPKNTVIEIAICKHIYDNQICEDLSLINDYTYYYDSKKCVLALGYGSIYNHASDEISNVIYLVTKNKIIYETTKDIQKNQQLTIDYSDEWVKNRKIKIKNDIIYAKKTKSLSIFISKKLKVKNYNVYADEKILKGEIIEISHTINFENIFYLNKNHSLSKLLFYNKEDNFLLPLGYANIYSVRDDSNVVYFIKNKKVYFKASRNIKKDEIITISKQRLFNIK